MQKLSPTARRDKLARDLAAANTRDREIKRAGNQRVRRAAIKAGVNIPKSVFFVHEDSAFMWMTNKVLGNIPQYVIKNILLVHNRNHPKKRMYIKDERKVGTLNEKRRSNAY